MFTVFLCMSTRRLCTFHCFTNVELMSLMSKSEPGVTASQHGRAAPLVFMLNLITPSQLLLLHGGRDGVLGPPGNMDIINRESG